MTAPRTDRTDNQTIRESAPPRRRTPEPADLPTQLTLFDVAALDSPDHPTDGRSHDRKEGDALAPGVSRCPVRGSRDDSGRRGTGDGRC